jgi:hypothetical protein
MIEVHDMAPVDLQTNLGLYFWLEADSPQRIRTTSTAASP